MKIGVMGFLRVLLVLVILAAAGLYVIYKIRVSDVDSLKLILASTENSLPPLVAKQDVLKTLSAQTKNQMDWANTRLDTAVQSLSSNMESTEYGQALFALAKSNNLNIAGISTAPTVARIDGGLSYYVSTYQLTLSGNPDDISKFLQQMVDDTRFQSVAVTNIDISDLDQAVSTARIELSCFAYKVN